MDRHELATDQVKPSPTIWITGLSMSGKSVLAQGLTEWLEARQISTQILDGRDVRDAVGDFLGYSREERLKVSRIMSFMATMLNTNGVTVIATAITPYQESRAQNRTSIENYFEIYLDCAVEACIGRDTHGNYAKALRGDLTHFIGVDDPFEVPKTTDLKIDTAQFDSAECLHQAKIALESLF